MADGEGWVGDAGKFVCGVIQLVQVIVVPMVPVENPEVLERVRNSPFLIRLMAATYTAHFLLLLRNQVS